MKDRKNKTKISQYTIEELVLFRDISPVITVGLPIDDSNWKDWKDEFDKIIANRNGTIYEEIKYYYNMKVLPLIREEKLKKLLDEQ